MSAALRCISDALNYRFDDENQKTVTSKDQITTELLIEKCFKRFEQLECLDHSLPHLLRKEHIKVLETSLVRLTQSYECLDSSRPWLVYWILNAAHLLNHKFSDSALNNVIEFLIKCRGPEGGFAGGPAQYPQLAPTYAAVNSLCIIGTEKALKAIDKPSLLKFLWSVREPNGAFRMHVDGEIDVRGAYCAISCAKLCNISRIEEEKLFSNTAAWIVSCQTYEGGFGGTPDLEAHGGYSFCAAAALTLLGTVLDCDLKSLLRWSVNRQMQYEGGFQGRTNKLVDGCYSFWQGALVPIVQALMKSTGENTLTPDTIVFNREALQEYVLICCQRPNGGLIDKPGKPTDLYHTCYTLSGLSISQHCEVNKPPTVLGHPNNELLPTHPIHNIPPKAVMNAYIFFETNTDFSGETNIDMGMDEDDYEDDDDDDDVET